MLALLLGAGGLLDLRAQHAVCRRQDLSRVCSSPLQRSTRWAMAATMPRRPWGSLPDCYMPKAISASEFLRAVMGCPLLPNCDGPRNLSGRLAHRADNGFEDHPPQSNARFLRGDGGAITLFLATCARHPRFDDTTITGAIIGVGAARKASSVRWNIAGSIVIAWVITLPAAALISAFFYICVAGLG